MSNFNRDLFLEPTVKQYGSHMVMTNVHKTNKTKYINIDTRFRDEYQNNEIVNYNVTLPERINDIKQMSVKAIELPMTMYNISSALGNNYFKISNIPLNASKMIVLPDGQYTLASLSSFISSEIANTDYKLNYLLFGINNNKSSFYRVSYDGANSQENNYNITIDFAVDKDGNFDKYNLKTKLGWLLGYRNISYEIKHIFDNNISIYTNSESFIDLYGSKYLYLAINEFSKSNPSSFITPLPTSFINKSIIARITLDNSKYIFNSILPANIYNGLLVSDVRTYNGKIDIQKLNLQLLNEFGNPISLNEMDFSLCLEVEYE